MAAAIVVLPTPPFPMTMTSPLPAPARSSTSRARPGRAMASDGPVSAAWVAGSLGREQGPQRRQADHVETAQRDLVPGQRGEGGGKLCQGVILFALAARRPRDRPARWRGSAR